MTKPRQWPYSIIRPARRETGNVHCGHGHESDSVVSTRVVERSTPNPDTGPADHQSDRAESPSVEDKWTRQIDGESVGDGGRRDGKDSDVAASGTRRESKRLDTDPLADERTGQRRHRERGTRDVPRPSTPPPGDLHSPESILR